MKSSTAITLIVIIALVVAGIFLFSGDQEATPEETDDVAGEEIEEEVGELVDLDSSDEVFNSIDDALQILE